MNARQIRILIRETEARLQECKADLARMEASCRHQWGEAVHCPIIEKAYTAPGDPPGTMGVDWRGPTYVPAKTTNQWSRTCKLCDKVEFTTNVNKSTVESPRF